MQLATRVVGLDADGHQVSTDDGRTLTYDACVLAVGSAPSPLPVPGGDHPDVRLLRSRTHASQLRDAASAATSVIVVGSGFIGCEAACSVAKGGREVVMVSQEERPQQARLGPRPLRADRRLAARRRRACARWRRGDRHRGTVTRCT